jgi:hypothetical protein
MERLTVGQAAERLQITEQAVRKRLQRGTLPHAKQDGHVYVYLDYETSAVGQEKGMQSDRQITLNYVDKLYSAWQTVDAGHSRFFFWRIVLSVLVLALSGGAVVSEEQVTISGIGLRVPIVIFIVTGVALILVFTFLSGSLDRLSNIYIEEIRRLYESLGLDNSAMNSRWDPFVGGDVGTAVAYAFATRTSATSADGPPSTYERGSLIIFTALLVILPSAAQAGAGYKVSELLDADAIGWFRETVAYIGQAFGYMGLPQQGADWISDLFLVLAFATTSILFWQSAIGQKESLQGAFQRQMQQKGMADADAPGLIVTISTYGAYVVIAVTYLVSLFFAWMGIWLGYVVAAS